MKKRALSFILAGAMAFAMGTAAFAADADISAPGEDGTYGQEVDITTEVSVPTISIIVPTTSTVVINPYKLDYEIEGTTVSGSGITALEQTIENKSDVPISVSATLSATPAGDNKDVVLATTKLKGTETTKSIFAYLEVKAKDAASDEAAFASSFDTKSTNQAAFTTKATTKKDIVTLTKKDSATGSCAGFKIMGEAAVRPAKAWTSNDKVDFNVTFTFDPVLESK